MQNWANKIDQLLSGDESEMLSKNRYKQNRHEEHELRGGKQRSAKGAVRVWKNKMG